MAKGRERPVDHCQPKHNLPAPQCGFRSGPLYKLGAKSISNPSKQVVWLPVELGSTNRSGTETVQSEYRMNGVSSGEVQHPEVCFPSEPQHHEMVEPIAKIDNGHQI